MESNMQNNPAGSPRRGLPVRIVLALLRGYKVLISPWLAPCCRFYPSCSVYCAEAVARHGVVKGLWMGALRLGRCHPLHAGGVDPVPSLEGKVALHE